MYRRIVHTLVGALAGYLVGAVVGMLLFAWVNGFRSVAIVEESNRNRWAFVAAAGAAVVGGLIAWWRSYGPSSVDAAPTEPEAGSGAEPESGAPAVRTSHAGPARPVPSDRPAGPPVADGTAGGQA